MSYDSPKIQVYEPIMGYNHLAHHYKSYHHKLDQRINRRRLQFLPRDISDKTIVDIGWWDGRLIKYFKDIPYKQYILLDGSQTLLDHAPSSNHVHKIHANLEDHRPLVDDSIDIWLCFFVVWHLSDITHFCNELSRISKPWAQIIIQYHRESKPYIHHIWADIYKIQTYQHNLDDIVSELQYTGFEIYTYEIREKNSLTSRILVCTLK